MSHASVLDPRFRNDEGAYGIMIRLLCRLGARLRKDGYFAQMLRVSIKDVRGNYWQDAAILPCVQDTQTLLEKFTNFGENAVGLPADEGGTGSIRPCHSNVRIATAFR